MRCAKCGREQAFPAGGVCPVCGSLLPPETEALQKEIPNYLVFAILTTVFCCEIFGIPALIYAVQVNSRIARGDRTGALESSRKAKMWCVISLCVGIPVKLGGVVWQIIDFIRSVSQAMVQ